MQNETGLSRVELQSETLASDCYIRKHCGVDLRVSLSNKSIIVRSLFIGTTTLNRDLSKYERNRIVLYQINKV
jgi:hypothetical protein